MAKGWREGQKICVIVKGQIWEAPPEGKGCTSRAHGHMTRRMVDRLIREEKMEFVKGVKQNAKTGQDEDCWIPVATFVEARRWRKKMSVDENGAVASMQLVP